MAIGHTVPARGDVYLVQLDPTRGSEIRKARPCLVVSPDELNEHLRTVIIAPRLQEGKRIRGEFRVGSRIGVDLLRPIKFVPSMSTVWPDDLDVWLPIPYRLSCLL